MKKIKRFIYEKMAKYYGKRIGLCVESFEMASLDGDHSACEYWDDLLEKYLAKQHVYTEKLRRL